MKKILLCIAILLLVCNAFSQTVAPKVTVAGLLKVAYSLDDFETYLTKRGFKYVPTNLKGSAEKNYEYRTKTTNYSCYLQIYNNNARFSTLMYFLGNDPAEFLKLVNESWILGFKYVSKGSGYDGDTTWVFKRDRTKFEATIQSKHWSGVPTKSYHVTIKSPPRPRVVSEEKAKPKRCSDEGSYDKGYTWAGNQKGLLADCDYLFDIAQATDSGPLSRYCFCLGVEAYRKQNR